MYNWLLNIVMDTTTGDDIPGGVAYGTGFNEDNWEGFVAGVIVGLLITLLFRFVKYLIKLCKEDDTTNTQNKNDEEHE